MMLLDVHWMPNGEAFPRDAAKRARMPLLISLEKKQTKKKEIQTPTISPPSHLLSPRLLRN